MEIPMREDNYSIETEKAKEPETDKREWTTPRMETVNIAEVTEAGLVSSLLDKLAFFS
jgi:hypothetical protein